jgi:SAM-dependent methyltransferase
MNFEKVAKNFWESTNFYPNYPFVKERRKCEIDYLLSNIPHETQSLLDIGCGNGSTVILLRELTYIKDYYCFDISKDMLATIGPNRDSNLHLITWDANTNAIKFPKTDVTISMNMLVYVFDDAKFEEIVKAVQSDTFIVRLSCDTEKKLINTHSADLGKDYSACYRTVEHCTEVFQKYYKEVTVSRAFSDEIESKYGNKQMFFLCKR